MIASPVSRMRTDPLRHKITRGLSKATASRWPHGQPLLPWVPPPWVRTSVTVAAFIPPGGLPNISALFRNAQLLGVSAQGGSKSPCANSLANMARSGQTLQGLAKPPQSRQPLHVFRQRHPLSPMGRLLKGSLNRPSDVLPLPTQRVGLDLAQK